MNAFKNTCLVLLILALGFLMYLYSEQDKKLAAANETIALRDQQIKENDQTIMNQNAQLMRLTSNPSLGATTNPTPSTPSAAGTANSGAGSTANATGSAPTANTNAAASAQATANAAAFAAAQAQAVKDATTYDAAVQKLIKLPPNEGLPSFATVKDAAGLKKLYPFFKDAQNGDLVLIYKDQMVIYRKAANKVISVKLISEATMLAK